MSILPEPLFLTILFLLGCIIGSFLDVFSTRFHTGKSLNGRSRCLSCGHTLEWYELFPLFSYLFLRGRCRVCHARIPLRLFWMELLAGAIFVWVGINTTSLVELGLGLVIASLAIIIMHYDVRHLVIPNAFVLAMSVLAIAVLIFNTRLWQAPDWGLLFGSIVSGVVAAAFFGALWVMSQGRWIGLGDAKLALPLGIMLPVGATFSFVVLSFWVGAIISIILLALQWLSRRGQTYLRFFNFELTMKSEVPFAPFLLIAFALVYLCGVDVLALFSFVS